MAWFSVTDSETGETSIVQGPKAGPHGYGDKRFSVEPIARPPTEFDEMSDGVMVKRIMRPKPPSLEARIEALEAAVEALTKQMEI